jgi:basic amino acid/polyamine antiporter, APA family
MTIQPVLEAVSRSRRGPVLRRRGSDERPRFGLTGLFIETYAIVGASVYFAVGVVAIYGLGVTPAALLVGGLIVAVTIPGYAEIASMFPERGGSASLVRHALGELAGFVAGWASLLALITIVALSALFVPHYLGGIWAPLATSPWDVISGVAIIASVAAVNVAGIRRPAGVTAFLVVANLATLALIVLLGASLVFRPDRLAQGFHLGALPSVGHLVFAGALATVAYAGFESIGNMSTEARNPDSDVRRAATLVTMAAVAGAVAIAIIAMMAMPVVETATGSHTTRLAQPAPHGSVGQPIAGIVSRLPVHVLATGLRAYIGLVAGLALFLAAIVCIGHAARIVHFLADHAQLPALAGRDHATTGTPFVAILGSAVVAAGLLLMSTLVASESSFLAATEVYSAMISATIVQAAVIGLRWTDPHRDRPFKVRMQIPVRGRQLPLAALAGGVATTAAWLSVLALPTPARFIGSAWMLAGITGYIAYRRRRHIGLNERRDHTLPTTVTGPRFTIEFRSILIPVSSDQTDAPSYVLDVASRLAGESSAIIVLLVFTEIPRSEEMDVEIPDLEPRVNRLAAQAREIADQYGIRLHTTHLRTRDPADTILAEADRRRSQVILLSATGIRRASYRGVARDPVARRVTAEARTRVMFIQPEPTLA